VSRSHVDTGKSKRGSEYPTTTTFVLRYSSSWETLKVNSLATATDQKIQRELALLRGWRPTSRALFTGALLYLTYGAFRPRGKEPVLLEFEVSRGLGG
jgi:hypothetical protein